MIYIKNIDGDRKGIERITEVIKEFKDERTYEIYDLSFLHEYIDMLPSNCLLLAYLGDFIDVDSMIFPLTIKDALEMILGFFNVKHLELLIVDDSSNIDTNVIDYKIA